MPADVTTIETAVIAGGIAGLVIGLFAPARGGWAALCLIPVAMLAYTFVSLSDPSRKPDALDPLHYLFNPLWPSLGALMGFGLGKWLRLSFTRKGRKGS